MCEYMDVYRHWHAGSEQYTGADSLVTILLDGGIIKKIFFREHWLHGIRKVIVYYVELHYAGNTVVMAVVANPYLERLLMRFSLPILPLRDPYKYDVDALLVKDQSGD